MPITIIRPDGTVNISEISPNVKVSNDDTVADFIESKIVAGTNVTITTLNSGGNEQLEISAAAGQGANTVKATSSDTTATELDGKIVAGASIVFTTLNPGGNEQIEIGWGGGDANEITYTPQTLSNWLSNIDPGNTDDALDQLASRVTITEAFTASDISYTPNTLTDWNLDTDPGETSDAIDQLASRLKTVELGTTTPDASGITYTPAIQANWNNLDPGNIDGALDFLADRTANGIDAAGVLYSPNDNSNWDGNADPGNTDGAIDQLASRVNTLESASIGTVSVSINDANTGFLEAKIVGNAPITVSTLNDGGNEQFQIGANIGADVVTYTPNDVANWSGNIDPGNTDNAVDQLAARLTAVEALTTNPDASEVIYTPALLANWDGSTDPGNTDDALDQLAARVAASEFVVKVSSNDTTGGFLENKLVAGTRVSLTVNNEATNENITIEALPQDASIVTYTPNLLSDWNGGLDPGNSNAALDQLVTRIVARENINAFDIDFTSGVPASDWPSGLAPTDVGSALNELAGGLDAQYISVTRTTPSDWDSVNNDAQSLLDELASRVRIRENKVFDVTEITYTPSVLANWDSDADPGDDNDALDQLASRVATEETRVYDAGTITYSPSLLTNWNLNTDPGNTNGALDQLADRVTSLESGTGATPDAAGVTYTPSQLTDWDTDSDPGNADAALDQLASRVNTLEAGGSGGGGGTGFLAIDTTVTGAETVPADHQTIYVGGYTVGTGGSITVEAGGEIVVLPEEIARNANELEYIPDSVNNWNTNTDPGSTSDALDQLADRTSTVEANLPTVIVLYRKWDTDAPPLSSDARDDEFNDGIIDPAWSDYGNVANLTSKAENEFGLDLTMSSFGGGANNPDFIGMSKAFIPPAQPYTIITKASLSNRSSGLTDSNTWAGILLLEGTGSGTGNDGLYCGFRKQSDDVGIIGTGIFGGFNVTGLTNTNLERPWSNSTAYFRIQINTSGFIRYGVSVDGIGWENNLGQNTIGFTPTAVALVGSFGASASIPFAARFRFFRVYNTAEFEDKALGREIEVYGIS